MVMEKEVKSLNFIEEIIEADIKMENMEVGYKPDSHPNQMAIYI